jgi:sulfur carrier protein ThiS
VPLEVKIEDILAGLDCNPDEIAVISGGNIPERKNCKADAVLTVNKNDGVVLIIS